jgi:hypothetical protein
VTTYCSIGSSHRLEKHVVFIFWLRMLRIEVNSNRCDFSNRPNVVTSQKTTNFIFISMFTLFMKTNKHEEINVPPKDDFLVPDLTVQKFNLLFNEFHILFVMYYSAVTPYPSITFPDVCHRHQYPILSSTYPNMLQFTNLRYSAYKPLCIRIRLSDL